MKGAGTPPAAGACPPGLAASATEMVDVVLDLEGARLPPEFELPLFRAVARLVPWIDEVPAAGILPVRGNRQADGSLLLARRAKLVIRLPRDKVCAASVLEQASLPVVDARIRLGQGTFRRLQPSPTLYSPRVVTGDDEEAAFTARVRAEMDALGAGGSLICGRRSTVARDGREYAAWGLAVHGLAAEHSLALQRAGLGVLHDVGCGMLVPHKTIHVSD